MELLPIPFSLPSTVKVLLTSRKGGVSDSPFHSLNLSINVGDENEAVYENRMRVASALPSPPRWLRQAHTDRVLPAEQINSDVDVADATYTHTAGVVCAVQTADCLPVLFYHADGSGVGAAHAGWRGLAAGVLENTVAAMTAVHNSPLHACIGPTISQQHFVVGGDVYTALATAAGDDVAFTPHTTESERWYADLPELARRRLLRAGVEQINDIALCTYAERELLFSARRDCYRTGRQSALIYFTA